MATPCAGACSGGGGGPRPPRRRCSAGLRFHDLRHTFVAFWVAAGKDPKWVSVRAGHSSVAFTLDRYGHLYEDRGDEAEALDALLAGARARSASANVRPI
jgi:integrase